MTNPTRIGETTTWLGPRLPGAHGDVSPHRLTPVAHPRRTAPTRRSRGGSPLELGEGRGCYASGGWVVMGVPSLAIPVPTAEGVMHVGILEVTQLLVAVLVGGFAVVSVMLLSGRLNGPPSHGSKASESQR